MYLKELKTSKIILIVGLGLLICIVPLSPYGQSKAANEMARNYKLSEEEIKLLQDQALKGAKEPAFRLFLFYDLYLRDYKEGNFWEVIAAENGHAIGQYNLAVRLNDDPDPRNRKRARFWLERAAQNGDKEAIKDLNKLKQKESAKNDN